MNQAVPRMPPGRFTKAARDAWLGWWLSGQGAKWSPAEVTAARRLVKLLDDEARSKEPAERRRLAAPIRTLQRDLGLVGGRVRPEKLSKHQGTIDRNKVMRALCPPRCDPPRDLAAKAEALIAENRHLPIDAIAALASERAMRQPARPTAKEELAALND